MLKFMRKNASSVWIKAAFLIIVVVFILWGVGGMLSRRQQPGDMVAEVNEHAITSDEVDRAYQNLLDAYRNMFAKNASPELLKALHLRERALDELIRVNLMQQEAERLGLGVTDDEVRRSIEEQEAFQRAGQFDRTRYMELLRGNRLTPTEYEATQREQILVDKLQNALLAGVYVSDAEARQQYDYQNEKISLRYLEVSDSKYAGQGAPSDDEISKYYGTHKDAYKEPARRRIELAAYPMAVFADRAKVDDTDVQKYYEAHKSDFQSPEQVHVRHILVKVPEGATEEVKQAKRGLAQQVLDKARGGEDFSALARQYSEDDANKDRGGDLGLIGRNQMVKPFEDAAFALQQPGQLSDVVETQFGFEIIQLDEKRPAGPKPLAEVRDEVVPKVRQQKGDEARRQQAQADMEKAAGGQQLAALAQASGVAVADPQPFAASEGIQGVGRLPQLSARVFATDVGKVGEVDAPQASYVFRVAEEIPARVPELAQIRDRVIADVDKEKAKELARKAADDMLAELKKSKDLQAVAAAHGLAPEETAPFGRNDASIPGIGSQPELQKDAFSLTSEQPVAPKTYASDDKIVVAMLDKRVPVDESKFAEKKDEIKKQILSQRKGMVLQQFADELKARYNVHIRPEYLARMDAQERTTYQ